MRSLGLTLILALLAALASGLACWQWTEGSFYSVLGKPPTPVGERMYSGFSPADVKLIRVAQNGTSATFEFGPDGWHATLPWVDRMDPRAAVNIINFTLSMRVEDLAVIEKVDPQKAGLLESGVSIRLEGANHRTLAKYKLGRQTPWLATVNDIPEPVPTVFIQPREAGLRSHIYACTGDIIPLFRDNLRFLRDHHPFYFNPLTLSKIRLRAKEVEITLARETPKSPWRVILPIELPTDPKAIKSLIEGLFELQATKISDRSSVTLPASGTAANSRQIALTSFGSEAESILEIYPPETPEATEVRATVSNRPDTIFNLPLKPEADLVSLADLPLTIDDLRDATLTHLNLKDLRGILIEPSIGSEILLSWSPPQPWMATIDGHTQEANQESLVRLLNTAIDGKATGFETDAATDFTPWGLDKPIMRLRFVGAQNDQVIELAFGLDSKGGYFVNRSGTPTVMRVDKSLVDSIPRKPYEWRHSRLWSIDRIHLRGIDIKYGDGSVLSLLYDFNKPDPWTARQNTSDLTPFLNSSNANYLLDSLEGLKVTRWLPADDASALDALARPSLTISFFEQTTNDMDDITGAVIREVQIAPGSKNPNPGFYYGRVKSDPNPFLLGRDTYEKLATGIIEKH